MSRCNSRRPWRELQALILLAGVVLQLHATNGVAAAVDSVNVSLDPLIDSAAHDRNRFAVNIPHSISSSTEGLWAHTGSTSTWTYGTRTPTAISMSFHASHLVLPPSAVLTVTAGPTHATYRAKDISRGGLWSRPLIGDTLEIAVSEHHRSKPGATPDRQPATGLSIARGRRGRSPSLPPHRGIAIRDFRPVHPELCV
jgi:hypothetical protein